MYGNCDHMGPIGFVGLNRGGDRIRGLVLCRGLSKLTFKGVRGFFFLNFLLLFGDFGGISYNVYFLRLAKMVL